MWLGVLTMAHRAAQTDWLEVINKFGPITAIAAFLVWFITLGVGGDIRSMRMEHQELGYYLREMCMGINAISSRQSSCTPPLRRGPAGED